MDLDFAQLRTFATVLDEGTFESAAAVLRVTPSAVSQRIKSLEQHVGQVLVRRTRPVSATAAGEVVMRLARQVARLEQDASEELGLGADTGSYATIPLVVNADSMSTWLLRALARMPVRYRALFELHREDEFHSTDLLRDGTAMAAVTSVPEPVQGCTSEKLGAMRYHAMASVDFAERWFPEGMTPTELREAPMLTFDRKDDMQDRFVRKRTRRRLNPPRNYVPGALEFVEAARLGLGWAMLPDAMVADTTDLVSLAPDDPIAVPLYWQRWRLDSPVLDALTDAVRRTAREVLH
ncbi:LysR family transcriptional regulator ArgP [Rhodococcus rhodochrous]|uniref:LysR family transcriptional regulator ArgP n=1 Tax=Rhodococcus rhodochrous TaxID=1829 RepID=A0AA47ABT0_RHORH|nr:LysR family transcriptional regulator ArgP [Rhodococcus rhodochrous]MCR8694551.1 LysR family transcriptional regulator ArgP [Rhodococcus pyridinivorans]MCD2098912.1 LysR family transcriptional regulator ArgP [Rhodococcus rhodochrous]MCD2123502.1 LysR family transcriptional regulator ArgP [Rhodococcus rhodochrous]MCQ4135083.1 LysR family transcriptional regulator ArgP [Rhodococcus rhodochrous]MDJ0020182.1 LysR family transcriptional regulator ArgP [Rhodococcus rhodochrous]